MIKLSIWLGRHTQQFMGDFAYRLRRLITGAADGEDPDTEGQVSSLSGLIVGLLFAVIVLIFWATSPRAQTSAVVQFLSIGATPAPPASSFAESVALPEESVSSLPADTGGTIVFSMYTGGQQELFGLAPGQTVPTRLTDNPADDRHPVWSPTGDRIAFASRRDGNWELYILHLATGDVSRLTYDLAYEAAPTWSPDGAWLAYEAYYEGNLDLYVVRADGSEPPQQLTRNPGADHSPAWSTEPSGRRIAYISHRENAVDIYLLSLDDPREELSVRLTGTPDIYEQNPSWNFDGTYLAYTAIENGISLVYALTATEPGSAPVVVGQGSQPAWAPTDNSLVFTADREEGSLLLTGQLGTWSASVRAFALPGFADHPDWSAASLPEVPRGSLAFAATAPQPPAYEERLVIEPEEGQEAPYSLVNLQPLGVIAEAPNLSDRVDGSFSALRTHVNQQAGWDFLGQLDSVWWEPDRPVEPGQDYHNWHKAGRAFDIVQNYNLGDPAQIEVVPFPDGPEQYWRIFVRCAIQDGSLGEPLKQRPWNFGARAGGDVDAYESGGQLRGTIPSGYYVDFTEVARLYGWSPVPADSAWRYNWSSILFWQYEKREGLDWWAAMRELYTEQQLTEIFGEPPQTRSPFEQYTVSLHQHRVTQ